MTLTSFKAQGHNRLQTLQDGFLILLIRILLDDNPLVYLYGSYLILLYVRDSNLCHLKEKDMKVDYC